MTTPIDTHRSVQEYQIGHTVAKRISLARTPTELQFLPRLSEEVGANIWIKRDDTTDTVACGNKLRKLEFSVAQALSEEATLLLTNGGVQSNHCRATALVAANLGLQAHLILRGANSESAPDGNLLLNELLGADTTFIDIETWRRIDEFTAELVADYARTGVTAFAIPTGASDEIGLWGYIRGFEELHNDLLSVGITPDAIIHATGSGGTQAGLILGAALMGISTRIVGINVSDTEEYFTRKITDDLLRWKARYQANHLNPVDIDSLRIEILDGHVGPGYGHADSEVFDTMRKVARLEGIVLDPVYTGKAFDGMLAELASGRLKGANHLVFVHTGGIYGLFPQKEHLFPR